MKIIWTVGLLAALASPAQAGPAGRGPFDGLAGSWRGSGTLSTTNGVERINCVANYVSSGNAMEQDLRCVSKSAKFDVQGQVVADGVKVSGGWSEKTRSVSGSVSGRGSGRSFEVRIDSPGFSGLAYAAVSQGKLSLQLKSSTGIGNASITLHK